MPGENNRLEENVIKLVELILESSIKVLEDKLGLLKLLPEKGNPQYECSRASYNLFWVSGRNTNKCGC